MHESAHWSSLPLSARLLLRWFSLLVRLYIIRGTAAITVILATRTTATTRSTAAMAGEATIGLGGGIGTTAGIMVAGAGGVAGTGGARRTRLAWRRLARPSLTRSLRQDDSASFLSFILNGPIHCIANQE